MKYTTYFHNLSQLKDFFENHKINLDQIVEDTYHEYDNYPQFTDALSDKIIKKLSEYRELLNQEGLSFENIKLEIDDLAIGIAKDKYY